MPPQKRRGSSVSYSRLKKQRKNNYSYGSESDIGSTYYKIKDIINENKTHYLIDWEDDPKTGEKFIPTWEPKRNANKEAVKDWQRKKDGQRAVDQTAVNNSRAKRRNYRVIESSSPASTELENSIESADCDSNTRLESEPSESDVQTPAPDDLPVTAVQIGPLPIHLNPEDYPTYHEDPASQLETSISSESLPKDTQSSGSIGHVFVYSDRIVPDSQSSGRDNLSTVHNSSQPPHPESHETTQAKAPSESYGVIEQNNDPQQETLDLDEVSERNLDSQLKRRNSSLSQRHTDEQQVPILIGESNTPNQYHVPPEHRSPTTQTGFDYQRLFTNQDPSVESLIGNSIPNSDPRPHAIIDLTLNKSSPFTIPPESSEEISSSINQDAGAAHLISSLDSASQRILHVSPVESPGSHTARNSSPLISENTAQPPLSNEEISLSFDLSEPVIVTFRASTTGQTSPTMSRTPQYGPEQLLNGPRPQQLPSSQHVLPMQDRVREIRAMPSPGAIDVRKANIGAVSPYDSRSPSIAPEPLTSKSVGDPRLEVQPIDISRPHQPTQVYTQSAVEKGSQSPSKQSQEFSDLEELRDLGLGPMEFAVSLSMPTRVRDQYNSTVQFFNKHVKAFLSGNTDQATIDSMRRLINRLNNVSTHIDLEDDTTQTQREHEVPPEDEANWAVSSSGKFQFLKYLLHHLQEQPKCIAIVAKPNRLLDILEKFLIGLNYNYYREDNGQSNSEAVFKSVKVLLVSSTTYQAPTEARYAHLVIALDTSFRADIPNIRALRTWNHNPNGPSNPDELSPVVRPMVYCSAEHIQKCVTDGLPVLETDLDRLKATIACISRTRSEVGVLQEEESKPDASAEEVASFVVYGGHKVRWSLPNILPIKISGLEILVPDTDQTHRKGQEHPETVNIPGSPASKKRIAEDTLMEDSPKRNKAFIVNDDSHVSESIVASQTAQISELNVRLEELQQALDKARINIVENEANATRIAALEATLSDREKELEEQRDAVTEVQTRYENRSRAFYNLKQESGLLEQKLAKSEQRYETLSTNYEKLREEKRTLDEELRSAHERLANSTVPSVADLEAAQAESRRLTSENESLKRKVESKNSEAEYAREEYQRASSSASEMLSRTRELETALAEQKRLAESARLQQDNYKTAEKLHVQNVEKARLEADELREQLRRRERGRGMTTRTTSVAPRSPRLGASPVRSRAGSRAPGSRPASPPRGIFGTSGRRPRGMVENFSS